MTQIETPDKQKQRQPRTEPESVEPLAALVVWPKKGRPGESPLTTVIWSRGRNSGITAHVTGRTLPVQLGGKRGSVIKDLDELHQGGINGTVQAFQALMGNGRSKFVSIQAALTGLAGLSK